MAATRRTAAGAARHRVPLPVGRPQRIGLALAGGGPLGAVYEIGALAALDDCLQGIDFNALDVYVGVSSGAFLAAGLANGIPPVGLSRMFIESEIAGEPFDPAMLLKPAYREYARRALSVPPLVLTSVWRYLSAADGMSLLGAVQRLGRAIPTGIFDGRAIERYLRQLFSRPGRTNDFRQLPHRLSLIATDLDSGKAIEFGAGDYAHIPISVAVQASAALPGLFPPVEIEGRHYVDGALKKTLHASVALRHGARLLLCINPLVPYDSAAPQAHTGAPARLVEGGLPAVLAQTFRSIIHSRMQVGMQRYEREYRSADVVLFEPNRHDAEMFLTNIFSYSSRRKLAEHAYQKTREELRERRQELAPVLARHGITIDLQAVTDPERRLLGRPHRRPHPRGTGLAGATDRLTAALDDLDRWLVQGGARADGR
jgi:predicted acylesterase/phospholipase RssA